MGDELLSGDTVNTNASDIGSRCRELGITLDQVITVRDRIEEISAAIRQAADADVCFVSGGLGPTSDDRTAEAAAHAAGVELRRDGAAVARLEAKFAAMGYEMPAMNLKQADFPATATIVPNPIGTAEGFMVPVRGCPVYVMPGVPREMRRMFDTEVAPAVAQRHELVPTPRRMYRSLGRGESSLAHDIEPIVEQARRRPGLESLFVHYRATSPQVLVVLEAEPVPGSGENLDVHTALRELDSPILKAMEPAIYGIGDDTLADRVVDALRRAGLRLCVAESCTAGGLGAAITAVPGSSAVFDGGIISYADTVKVGVLGVDPRVLETHGAVSEPVVRAMAEGARKAIGSDLAVSITGIAGPGGGSAEKPVGTVHIDVFDGEAHLHKTLKLRGNRGTVRHCSHQWALKLVWDRLCARGLASVLFSPDPHEPLS
ncbi:MAG: CinA family nicotinamide mononucleotide deamidase-related protein [Nannocystaceae bacterium]|nr:CinA family nicotinamide mononucleotide deamidase-related protein [Nannocystaceae bacterium]